MRQVCFVNCGILDGGYLVRPAILGLSPSPHGWPNGFVYAQAVALRGSMPMPLVLDKVPAPSEDLSPPTFFDVFQTHMYPCAYPGGTVTAGLL